MPDATKTNPPSATDRDRPARAAGAWWRLPLVLAAVLAAIVAARSSQTRERGPAATDASSPRLAGASGQTVTLTIQFGDGQERKFEAVPWRQGMTVDDLMTAVSRLPDGIQYTVRGDHEMTLLARIDESRNEGAGGNNWTYAVNDLRADRSLAVYELEPGDRVLWTFGPQE